MAEQHGTAGAVADLVAEVRADLAPQPEQLDLLAAVAAQRPTAAYLFKPEDVAAEVERTRRAGRPKGAQNLATRELRQWITQILGGTPQEKMARWASMEPEEIAHRMGCTRWEALQFLRSLWADLSPYLMARMQPVDENGKPVPFVNLQIGGQMAGANGGDPWAITLTPLDGELVDVTPAGDAP